MRIQLLLRLFAVLTVMHTFAAGHFVASAAEKIPKEIQRKLAAGAHPTPEQLGPGWEYMKLSPRLNSGERQFRRKAGGHVVSKTKTEDNLVEIMHSFANYADKMAILSAAGDTVRALEGIGDEAIIGTAGRDPNLHTVYLRVRTVYVKLAIHAPPGEVPGICRAFARVMEVNAKALLGERAKPPPPIAKDGGKPAEADQRMFKLKRASASGSSSGRIRTRKAAGEVRLVGRSQIKAGEDCSLRVEFDADDEPPAGSHVRDCPYFGNADLTVRDLWGREVPMTALGERVVAAADRLAKRLKPIQAASETELEIDITGWWSLSTPGQYLIDIRWPVFDAKGKQSDLIEARRFVFEVHAP